MSVFRGETPRQIVHVHRVARLDHFIIAALSWLIASLVLPLDVYAQETAGLSLAEAEQLALAEEPGQLALLARAEALQEQSVAAAQLPDPMLRLGLMNYPIEAGGFTTEGMTQVQVGVRQAFPPGQTRAARQRQFQSLAREANEHAGARSREVLSAVRGAWLDAYYWTEAQGILTGSRPYFEDLVTVTTSLYEVGRRNQQDVLRADLELSRLENRILDTNRQRLAARAALSEWVGSAAQRPLASELPAWTTLPDYETLSAGLEAHPSVQAAVARIAAHEALVDVQKQSFKPGWALDLGYGYRDGLLPNGAPRSDFVSLSVTADLPLFRRNRQDRSLAAAVSERRAARQAQVQLLRRLNSRLESQFVLWQELNRRIELYDQKILRQTRQQAEAALAAYRSEAGDFADVMRSYISERDTRLEYLRMQVERAQSYARIAELGGLTQ